MSDHKSRPVGHRPDPLTARVARWRAQPTDEEFLAAQKHLMLLFDDDVAALITSQFRDDSSAARVWDSLTLLHAANLPLLSRKEPHVTRELVRVAGGLKLSPVLFLRGSHRRAPIIVDGYPRICAAYHCDPDAQIPVKLV